MRVVAKLCDEAYEKAKDRAGFGTMIGTGAAVGAGVVCTLAGGPAGPLVAGGIECCVLTAGGSYWAGAYYGRELCYRDCDRLFPPPNCSGGGGNPGSGGGW